jgi:hypothetical protein
MTDLFEHRLRAAARAIPTPEAPPGLIDRVLAERASGQRAVLPAATTHRFQRPWFRAGLITLAAAVVVAVALVLEKRSSGEETAVVSSGLFIGTAFAGQIESAPAAPRLRLTSAALQARRYDYSIDFVDSAGRASHDGRGSIEVAATAHEGVPAWNVILAAEQTEGGQRRAIAETLVVAKSDLRLLTRVVHVRPYRVFSSINIAQRFTADSVLGEMTTDRGIRRPIARRLPERFGPFLSDAMAPLALAGAPLTQGSTFSLSLVGWAVVPMDVFYPVTVRVVGEERLQTRSGVFDCWKLDVAAGSQHRVEWVRKSDGIGLRSIDTQATPRGNRRFELLDP